MDLSRNEIFISFHGSFPWTRPIFDDSKFQMTHFPTAFKKTDSAVITLSPGLLRRYFIGLGMLRIFELRTKRTINKGKAGLNRDPFCVVGTTSRSQSIRVLKEGWRS